MSSVVEAEHPPLLTPAPVSVDVEFRDHGGGWVNRPLRMCVPSEMSPALNPTLVTDGYGLDKMEAWLRGVDIFGFDYETNIATGFKGRCARTIQVGDRNEQYVIDLLAFCETEEKLKFYQGDKGARIQQGPLRHVFNALQPSLETNEKLKVGVNLEFEYITSRWNLGLRPWHFYDCMLAEKVRWCGQVGFFERNYWAADDLTARYCGLKIDKTLQKSFDLCTPLAWGQVEYAALDTRIPLAIKNGQRKPLQDDGLMRAVDIENDAIPAFGDLHINGMHLNADRWRSLLAEVAEEHRKNIERMDRHFLPSVGHKGVTAEEVEKQEALQVLWKEETERVKRAENRKTFEAYRRELSERRKLEAKCEGAANIQYGSTAQLTAALREMGYTERKLESTNDSALEQLEGDPVIDSIRDFRTTEKVLSSYGEDWLAASLDTEDSRIHARFQQLAAETGRTSCQKPNMQQIPKGKDWRGCFDAPAGRKIVACDWDGQELRIMTDYSGEPAWIEAFEKKWDVHSMCADELEPVRWAEATATDGTCAFFLHDGKLKCKCPRHEKLRDEFKPLNFGIPYGKTEYAVRRDLKVSIEVAREKLYAWYARFKCHYKWLTEAAKHALVHRECRTKSGRRRLFPRLTSKEVEEKLKRDLKRPVASWEVMKKLRSSSGDVEKAGKNTPIQGTGVDMLKTALGCGFDQDGNPFLWHLLEPEYNALLVNEVHDEIVVEADEANAEKVKFVVSNAMERAGAMFVTKTRMTASGKVADRWNK